MFAITKRIVNFTTSHNHMPTTRANRVVMVGDYLFDLQPGKAAGAITIHVGRPDGQRWPNVSDVIVDNLADLV